MTTTVSAVYFVFEYFDFLMKLITYSSYALAKESFAADETETMMLLWQ